MTIEIRELIIEARVTSEQSCEGMAVNSTDQDDMMKEERLIEKVVQQVLCALREEKEGLA